MSLKWMLRLVYSGTAFWLLTSALVGCAGGLENVEVAVQGTERPDVRVSVPSAPLEGGPVLVRGADTIRLGITSDQLSQAFPRPRGAFDFFEEPPIQGESYVARGWQSSAEGIGSLSVRGRVVLALYTLENVEAETIAEITRHQEEANGGAASTFVPGELGSYSFWEHPQARLMLATSTDARGVRSLALALGDPTLMDALRMDPASARQDLLEAKTLLREWQESNPARPRTRTR